MSLGQSLVSARKGAGITLDELSTKTNIRPSLLREFENDNFSNSGGDTYARGHIRSIARVLLVPADEFLSQYDLEHASEKRAIHDQLVENNVTAPLQVRNQLTQKQLVQLSIGVFLIGLVVSFVVGNLRDSSNSPKPTIKPSASASPAVSESSTSSPSPSAVKSTYSSGSGVTVKLEATNGASWLFVSDKDGVTLYSGRATKGQILEFSSTLEVNLRIGNAGAVELTVNGKKVESVGGNGEVVNVSYGVNS